MSVEFPEIGDRVIVSLKGELKDLWGRVLDIADSKEQGRLSMFAIRIGDLKKSYWLRRSDFKLIRKGA